MSKTKKSKQTRPIKGAKRHCIDPSLEPEQKSKATSVTGTGTGDSQGCFKPENQGSCGVGAAGEPRAGTPLAEWEKEYGKLITTVSLERVLICGGHTSAIQRKVVKIPNTSTLDKKIHVETCCSLRYKDNRAC